MTVLFAIWATVACDGVYFGDDVVRVSITFDTDNKHHRLESIGIVAGDDRFFWPTLESGQTKSVPLKPDENALPQLFLSFVLDGTKQYWEGPEFPAGTGYRIALSVDEQGKVSEMHCTLPCQFD